MKFLNFPCWNIFISEKILLGKLEKLQKKNCRKMSRVFFNIYKFIFLIFYTKFGNFLLEKRLGFFFNDFILCEVRKISMLGVFLFFKLVGKFIYLILFLKFAKFLCWEIFDCGNIIFLKKIVQGILKK